MLTLLVTAPLMVLALLAATVPVLVVMCRDQAARAARAASGSPAPVIALPEPVSEAA